MTDIDKFAGNPTVVWVTPTGREQTFPAGEDPNLTSNEAGPWVRKDGQPVAPVPVKAGDITYVDPRDLPLGAPLHAKPILTDAQIQLARDLHAIHSAQAKGFVLPLSDDELAAQDLANKTKAEGDNAHVVWRHRDGTAQLFAAGEDPNLTSDELGPWTRVHPDGHAPRTKVKLDTQQRDKAQARYGSDVVPPAPPATIFDGESDVSARAAAAKTAEKQPASPA